MKTSAQDVENSASTRPWSDFLGDGENALASLAAEAILAPQPRFNPVVLCGSTGVGKSHLLHGLVERWRQLHPHSKAAVLTGADFARGYAYAVQTDTVAGHRSRLLQAGLLAIDGLEELARKSGAQQELIHTLDAALAEGVRVVVTSRESLAPGGMFLPGLASRLSSGLVVPMRPPGPAACRAILRRLIATIPTAITDEACELLATELSGTAAELRHALLQLCEATRLEETTIDETAVRRFLDERADQRRPTLQKIATQVARRFRLRTAELQGKTRRREVVQARGVAMLLARRLTGASYEKVGRHFGGRDHSTVMHACRRTAAQLKSDPALKRIVEELNHEVSVGHSLRE